MMTIHVWLIILLISKKLSTWKTIQMCGMLNNTCIQLNFDVLNTMHMSKWWVSPNHLFCKYFTFDLEYSDISKILNSPILFEITKFDYTGTCMWVCCRFFFGGSQIWAYMQGMQLILADIILANPFPFQKYLFIFFLYRLDVTVNIYW